MAVDFEKFENNKEEVKKAADGEFVTAEAGIRADRVVVGELDMRKMGFPIVISIIHHCGKHLHHYQVDAASNQVLTPKRL